LAELLRFNPPAIFYIITCLKRSKADSDHKDVKIVLLSVRVVVSLWRNYLIDALPTRLRTIWHPMAPLFYSDYSFRKGAAQHVVDNRILDEDLQRLGRWYLDAFKLSLNTSFTHPFSLNKRFLTGKS
jgi:hypothetical protein